MEALSEEEHARREALRSELEELEQRYFQESNDDLPEEVDQRLAEIEAELDAFESRPVRYDPGDVARAGAFVSVDGDGCLKVERGYVRPEDEAPAAAEGDDDVGGATGDIDAASPDSVDGLHFAPGQAPADAGTPSAEAGDADTGLKPSSDRQGLEQNGSAECRAQVCQRVMLWGVYGTLKK